MNIPSTKYPLTDDDNLAIGIIGLGAIGCLISSQLPSMATLYALPRKKNLTTFNFQINHQQNNDSYQLPIWNDEPLHILIICCKANQCEDAIKQWHQAINPETQIVLLQNGMGQHDYIASLYPNNPIYAASTTEGAFRTTAQTITHAGIGSTLWGAYNTEQAFKLPLNLLKGDHQWHSDIKQVLRDKLAINAVINPLTVKYQCKNGELLTQVESYAEIKELSKEIASTYAALNWNISFNLLERTIQVCQLTANNYSSMLQDVKNESLTEIDFINGYLLNQAARMNIAMPLSSALTLKIKR